MQLEQLGWDTFFSSQFDAIRRDGLVPARIAEQHRNGYIVYAAQGEFAADVSGRFRHVLAGSDGYPTVGDWVSIQLPTGGASATIHGLLQRRTRFVRKVPGGRTAAQVVAANVDMVFLVNGLDQNFNLRRIERYVTEAWGSGAQPVILLNKADVCGDADTLVRAVASVTPGVAVHAMSAMRNEGMDVVRSYLAVGRTIAFVGSSGVGKSTIINLLLGEDHQEVQAVSNAVGKGRHTTTSRSLLLCPGGGMIIDTPGMRELQLWVDEDDVGQSFVDIEMLAGECRFRNCTHTTEPGCAVTAAIADGSLDEERYLSYRKQQSEVRRLQRFQELREHTRGGDLSRVHGVRQIESRSYERPRERRRIDYMRSDESEEET